MFLESVIINVYNIFEIWHCSKMISLMHDALSFCLFFRRGCQLVRFVVVLILPLMFAGVVSDRKTSLPSKNHTSRILGWLVVFHLWTARQGTGGSSTKKGDWRNVENQIKIELVIFFILIFRRMHFCMCSHFLKAAKPKKRCLVTFLIHFWLGIQLRELKLSPHM